MKGKGMCTQTGSQGSVRGPVLFLVFLNNLDVQAEFVTILRSSQTRRPWTRWCKNIWYVFQDPKMHGYAFQPKKTRWEAPGSQRIGRYWRICVKHTKTRRTVRPGSADGAYSEWAANEGFSFQRQTYFILCISSLPYRHVLIDWRRRWFCMTVKRRTRPLEWCLACWTRPTKKDWRSRIWLHRRTGDTG